MYTFVQHRSRLFNQTARRDERVNKSFFLVFLKQKLPNKPKTNVYFVIELHEVIYFSHSRIGTNNNMFDGQEYDLRRKVKILFDFL